MPEYEGMVTMLRDDGTADVLVVPERSFIPGASDLNVCHCATAKSSVATRALNTAGAKVGDLAMLHLDAAPLARNLLTFLACPAAGALIGFLTGFAFPWWWTEIVFALAGGTAGLLAGIRIRRRAGAEHLPVIIKVVLSSDEVAGTCGKARGEDCAGCIGGTLGGN